MAGQTDHAAIELFRQFQYPTPPLHPDVHKITAAGAALSAHLSVLRAPRSLPSPIVMTR